MDKAILVDKISNGKCSHQQLMAWVSCLPGASVDRKPSSNKVGDVYMHAVFKHPYVLLEKQKGFWVCGLLTSESKSPEIIEQCSSRFFDGFITKTLFTVSEVQGSFLNKYDNTRHLKKVLIKLREILK
jgi:hypothetical protein